LRDKTKKQAVSEKGTVCCKKKKPQNVSSVAQIFGND
jgi:hypothetical protein